MENEVTIEGIELRHIVEAIIFASTEPITGEKIIECVQKEGVHGDAIRQAIEQLNKEYQQTQRSIRIVKIAGGYQFATHPQYDRWVGRLFKEKAERKLSQAALEVLAIVAYRQPITRAEIEKIRGVNADWTLRSLMEKNLITVVGREDLPGKPLLFGTTKSFLEHFGLFDIAELPKLKEIEDIIREDREFAETLELDFAGGESLHDSKPESPLDPVSDSDAKDQVEHNNSMSEDTSTP